MRKLLLCIFSFLILSNTAQAASSFTTIYLPVTVMTTMMIAANSRNNHASELPSCLNNGGGNACYIKNCLQNKGGNACYTKYKKERIKHEGN